jgi:hypothetical protein
MTMTPSVAAARFFTAERIGPETVFLRGPRTPEAIAAASELEAAERRPN